VDVYSEGFNLKEVPDSLLSVVGEKLNFVELGHLWYSDKVASKFITNMAQKYPSALFVLTGDHPSHHKLLNKRPSFFEKTAVPLLFYGGGIKDLRESNVSYFGSHTDISKTLVDIIAPQGFEYHSMGRNILYSDGRHYSPGWNAVISSDFIANVRYPIRFEALPGKELPKELPDPKEVRSLFNNNHAVSLWRVKNGPSFNLKK
jgi:hypothetical protein